MVGAVAVAPIVDVAPVGLLMDRAVFVYDRPPAALVHLLAAGGCRLRIGELGSEPRPERSSCDP